MLLANPEDVLERMSLNSQLSGGVASARSALEAATPILESLVGTAFTRSTQTDYFRYLPNKYKATPHYVQFYLENGFVDANSAFNVYVVSNTDNTVQIDANSLVDPQYYSVDYQRGILTLFYAPSASQEAVAVSYTSGMVVIADHFNKPPQWLREAGIITAIKILHNQSTTYNKKDLTDMSQKVKREMLGAVSDYVRPRMNGLFPVRSV